MAGWLQRGVAAARIGGERSDLWIPGALASLVFLGWSPFVLAVVPLPGASDLAFFGADVYTSSRWPANALALGAGVMLLLLAASLLIALAETTLLRRLRRLRGLRPLRPLPDDALRLWGVQLLAALPAAAAAVSVLIGLAAVAPAEYQSPDIGGTLAVRIVRDLLPFLALFAVAVIVGQTFGAAATHRAVGSGEAVAASLWGALRDLVGAPLRLLVTALVTLLAYGVGLLLAAGLLRVVWSPIRLQLANGQVGGPQTLLLLVGFVAIWLCLLIGAGALHAWASVWWALELEPRPRWPLEPSSAMEEIGQA